MKFSSKWLSLSLAVIFASANVGCGQGFKTSGQSANSSQSLAAAGSGPTVTVDPNLALQKAADATSAAQLAMDEANAAIALLTDSNGAINVAAFKIPGASQSLLQPMIDKLNGVFDKVFAKVDLVKTQFANARSILAAGIAKLSAADAAQAAQIKVLQDQLAKIDALELKFQTMIHGLAGKLDIATTAMEKLLATATSSIPVPGLGAVAGTFIDMFVMSDVKDLISTLKVKLLAV